MEMEVLEDGGGWLMMKRSGVEWRRRKWTIYIHEISGGPAAMVQGID